MEKIELGEVKGQLERINAEIAELKDKFWGSFDWVNGETAELETEIKALQEWKTRLEASIETITVLNNGGIKKDIIERVKNNKRNPINWVDLTRSER